MPLSMGKAAYRLTVFALVGYAVLAIAETWPLTVHLSTHLTGIPGGDTAVYVWNTWVFRHELIDLGRSPFSTGTVLALDGDANLALHNYTVFADLVTLPLQPWIGVVAAFNVSYLLNVALCGIGMFALAYRMTGRGLESWLAGALFALAPFLVARGNSHFSLAAAAPLPFFLYWLDRAWHGGRLRDAVGTGTMIAWAWFSDPYYAVYCLMLGCVYVVDRLLVLTPRPARAGWRGWITLIDVATVALVGLIGVVHFLAGGSIQLGSVSIAIRTLYTPMLLLSVLLLVRLLRARPAISWLPVPGRPLRLAIVIGVAAAILLAPEIRAIGVMMAEGGLVRAPVAWRSSAPGVDLISFLLPNPNHPLAPRVISDWLSKEPGQYDENVMSLSWIGVAIIAAAWRWAGYRPARLWVLVTLGFASLTIGPFLRVLGHNTYLPTPWTLLRYAPIIGEARMPQRFGVVVALGFSMMVAGALVSLSGRFPRQRGLVLSVVAMALAFELLPAPRTLHAASIPSVYRTIAAEPEPARLLELPFGIRDGLSSLGDFAGSSQFYQTAHGKPLVGGYLSRVEDRTKDLYRAHPFLRVLMDFSAGGTPSDVDLERAKASADAFVTDAKIGYVVIDTGRTSAAFRAFAADTLRLTPVDRDGPIELYRPGDRR